MLGKKLRETIKIKSGRALSQVTAERRFREDINAQDTQGLSIQFDCGCVPIDNRRRVLDAEIHFDPTVKILINQTCRSNNLVRGSARDRLCAQHKSS